MSALRRLIAGVGQPYRGDDAAGLLVAERLADQPPPDARVLSHRGDLARLAAEWPGWPEVVVVDCARMDAPPGTVRTLDAVATPLPRALFPASSHLIGLAEVVELARNTGRLPGALTIHAIAGDSFTLGSEPQGAVIAAVEHVVSLLHTAAPAV